MQPSVSMWLNTVRTLKLEVIDTLQDSLIEEVHRGLKEKNECTKPMHIIPEGSLKTLPDWGEALYAVGNIIIIIFSLCGNIGALLVISKSKMSKKSTKAYLVSLALCDLILTLTSPTVDLSQLMSRYGGWIFGSFLCKAFPFLQTMAIMGVAFCLVVIATERYLSVVRAFDPPSSNSIWRERIPSIAVFMIWTLSIGCAVPNIWYYKSLSFWTYLHLNETHLIRPRNETCETYYMCQRTSFDAKNIAYYGALGFTFLLLAICFTFCYISIIIFVRKHGNICKASSGNGGSQVSRNQRTLRLILGLILLYLLCRLPLWIFVVINNSIALPITDFTLFLFYGFHILSNVNSLANPFIYAIFNDSIRSNHTMGNVTRHNHNREKNYLSVLCYCIKSKGETAFEDNPPIFFDKSTNKYDFTKQSKFIASISTQKFNLSDRKEFAIAKTSSC